MPKLLRKPLTILLLAILLPAAVQLAVSLERTINDHRTEPPVAAAREFLAAVQAGDCDQAWQYFSAATQSYIEEQSRERTRREAYNAAAFAPRSLYCKPTSVHRFHGYRRKTARLKSQSLPHAVVSLDHQEADPKSFLIPGFWPTRFIITPVEMQMITEAGTWKIVVP